MISDKFLAVFSKPLFNPTVEEQIEQLRKEVDQAFVLLNTVLRDLTGESGASPTFYAEISCSGKKIVSVGIPSQANDVVTKKYLEEQLAVFSSRLTDLETSLL